MQLLAREAPWSLLTQRVRIRNTSTTRKALQFAVSDLVSAFVLVGTVVLMLAGQSQQWLTKAFNMLDRASQIIPTD